MPVPRSTLEMTMQPAKRNSDSGLEWHRSAPQHRILVIEDNPTLAEAIEITLTKAGHKTVSATDGARIFDLLRELKPDLLVTDVILPDFDSIDLIDDLRHAAGGMKIIAISGNPHLLRLAAKHGADHVLAKPFDLGALRLLIDVALN
jgi:two-component system response regulator AtoC